MRTRGLAIALLALPLSTAGLCAQASPVAVLADVVRDAGRSFDERCAALSSLQDEGALDIDTAVAALRAGADLGRTAAAILRHEWLGVPAELLDAITDDPKATALLLRELALAPRPSLQQWAASQVQRAKLPGSVRCLALAAAARPLSGRDADLLVRTATDENGGDGYRTAAWLLEPKAADRMIGRLHAALLQERTDFSRLLPFFDRLSPAGYGQLLGMAAALPDDIKAPLCRYFVQNDVPAFRARAEAALDGEIPLEAVWLARAEELLDKRSRIERLFAVLTDRDDDPQLQDYAFRALVSAAIVEEPVLRWADEAPGRLGHIRRVLDVGVQKLTTQQLVAWLNDDVRIAETVAAALLRRPKLEPEIEALLGDLLDGVVVMGPAQAFAMALINRGSAASVTKLWPSLRASPVFDQFVDALARRRAPWGHGLLLAELEYDNGADASHARKQQLDAARLALVSLGDRRQLEDLVLRARLASPAFVRRCAHYANPLGAKYSLQLLGDAAALTDDDLAVELIAWAATTQHPDVGRELLALWQPLELSERQLAALRGLALSPTRPALVAALQKAVAAGPLDDRHEALSYELISTMPTPLTRADVELLAELALLVPLGDPERERARAQRWHDGRFGFPMVAAVAHRLRGGDSELAAAVFEATAARVKQHPEFGSFARQRLVVLWRSLVPDPRMQLAIGQATAELLLAVPNSDAVGEGPARLFAMDRAERDGELEAAAAHGREAVAKLLRHPRERQNARLFLGERDPGAGDDPWSALAARPFVLLTRCAIARADLPEARRVLGLARDLAGRDAATLQAIDKLSKELEK